MAKNSDQKTIISPIAIDLGAKNTGVYFAHYEAGSPLDVFEEEGTKSGKVYQLDQDSYTYLMVNRTAARHQRRGFDRRQMAKRLFKLIWCKHFGLSWNKDVQQTIGFLMNRRGFSFLTEGYDADRLERFPEKAFSELPGKLKGELKNEVSKNDKGSYDFASDLIEWTNEGVDKVRSMFNAINQEPERIRRELVLITRTKKMREYCSIRKQGDPIPEERKADLSRLSNWILEEWETQGIKGLPARSSEKNFVDLVDYLNNEGLATANRILDGLPKSEDLKTKEKELKKSIWNFNAENFDGEKQDFDTTDEPKVKTHLHHLAFALHKTMNELESGGRHRSNYFKEVEAVLQNTNHSHKYLERFCEKLRAKKYTGLDIDSLSNLIGHISNLELKPLRKYFNDPEHKISRTNKQGDRWKKDRITELFERWILHEWRVNPQKDKQKAPGADYDYKTLKTNWKEWKEKNNGLIGFWLQTDPGLTIPPYQDNKNRRPPKCQSLLFNVHFLDHKYPTWEDWLAELKKLQFVKTYLGDYEEELRKLKSGKGKSYFNESADYKGSLLEDSGRRSIKELNARVLQFIFDRVKAEDELRLNEIYSHAKKYRQLESTEEEKQIAKDNLEKEKQIAKGKLEQAIKESDLPGGLKTSRNYENDLFEKSSFLHLVCKYYKQRQRARDGRIYIHPQYRFIKGRGYENTGRFYDKNHLLSYCNHKPRQKRYQTLWDLAGVLQVSPDDFKHKALEQTPDGQLDKPMDEKLVNWLLNCTKGLKTNCDKAAKEQKDRRGCLKPDIQNVFGIIYHRKKSDQPNDREVKKILENSKIEDALKLYRFCERAKGLCLDVTESLYDESRQDKWKEELEKNPATAVYLLAQINNIAFKERNGNAKTCPVCSADNARRMQMISTKDGKDTIAKAQKLPAIPTRVIDGAVMRMARIVGKAIANDKWGKIEGDLEKGNEVCIPIITESNRFEFEPSKEELVKGQRTGARRGKVAERDGEHKIFESKEERIKQNSMGICPYKRPHQRHTPLGNEDGEIDHIIPRSSKWGTLNDEANLIYASKECNQNKGQQEYSLNHLRSQYKQSVFETADDEKIEQWIIDKIGDGDGDDFKFGKYRSFINLDSDEQKAFRHALFLTGHPLREKVIAAINNKSRALVNGTQRYFAEVLANALYKKAMHIGKQGLLSFDYYGVEARSNSRGDGIYDLRKLYEAVYPEIDEYDKSKDRKQQAYSHLIDAQLAFVIVADAHRNGGGLKLKIDDIDDSVRKEPLIDLETGEIFAVGMLKLIEVPNDKFGGIRNITRRKPYDVETHHRELMRKGHKKVESISYQIHRDNLVAEKFIPLIQLENGGYKKGFSTDKSVAYKEEDFERVKGFIAPSPANKNVWLVKKKEALSYLMNVGRKGLKKEELKTAKLLDKLIYQTVRKKIQKALSVSNKEPETVSDALSNWDKCIREDKFKKDGVLLPIFQEWEKLKIEFENADPEESLQDFLKNSELFRDKQNSSIKNHNKKRKVYSLPMVATIGSIRLERRAWNGPSVIQTAADEGLSKYGLDAKQRPHTVLSKNSIPIKHYRGLPGELIPEPREWKEIPDAYISDYNKRSGGVKICLGKVKHQDAKRCRIIIRVNNIDQLSLPDKDNWQGKLFRYDTEDEREGKLEKEKGANGHYLSSEWQWFEKPFELPKDRNAVTIRKIDGIYEIEFTIQKTVKIKEWLQL